MPKKKPINLIKTNCKRCSKELTTTSRSLYGADLAKKKYDCLCRDCVTQEESRSILEEQAAAIIGR